MIIWKPWKLRNFETKNFTKNEIFNLIIQTFDNKITTTIVFKSIHKISQFVFKPIACYNHFYFTEKNWKSGGKNAKGDHCYEIKRLKLKFFGKKLSTMKFVFNRVNSLKWGSISNISWISRNKFFPSSNNIYKLWLALQQLIRWGIFFTQTECPDGPSAPQNYELHFY